MFPFGILIVAIVAVPVRILDDDGLPRYRALAAQIHEVEARNDRLREEVRARSHEVASLRSTPEAIERVARDELGMVREGEIVFQFAD